MYKAIGFDFGGVIKGYPGSYFKENVCKLLNISTEQYDKAYYAHNKKVNRGEVTWPQLWELVLGDLGKSDKIKEVMALSNDAFDQKVNSKVLSLADNLKKNGYKVGLLSNNTTDSRKLMSDLGVDKHFDVLDISAYTGFVKPEPEAFIHLAKGLGVNIKELVFIDDSEMSLSTAGEVGYTPVHFRDYDSLVEKLTKLGIKI